jgi:hypothetical protein
MTSKDNDKAVFTYGEGRLKIANFLALSALRPVRLTLASYLSEALIAVHGSSAPRLEGDFGLFAARSAGYLRLLAWSFGSSVAPLSPGCPAIRTAARFILQTARLVEFLLASSEYELRSTVTADQGLVCKRHR